MVTEELICPTCGIAKWDKATPIHESTFKVIKCDDCGQILLKYKKKFKPVRLVKIPKIVGRMFKYV